MIGKRVGLLKVVERLPKSRVRCSCDCGSERILKVGHFNAGNAKSCGCHVPSHRKSGSRTMISWGNMKARCHNPSNKRYKDYGGKGILVCERWLTSFSAFLEDMGECPEGMTIDRIDNTKGYEPGNCRWATRQENQRNRACSKLWFVYGVPYQTAAEAGTVYGVCQAVIAAWCKGRTAKGRWYPPKPNCWVENKYK